MKRLEESKRVRYTMFDTLKQLDRYYEKRLSDVFGITKLRYHKDYIHSEDRVSFIYQGQDCQFLHKWHAGSHPYKELYEEMIRIRNGTSFILTPRILGKRKLCKLK